MLIKRNGVFKTVPSNEFGIHQKAGWEKVIDNEVEAEKVAPKKEKVKVEPIVAEPEIEEIKVEPEIAEEPILVEETEPKIIEEELQTVKKGKNKNK